jgi:hypothetical protein
MTNFSFHVYRADRAMRPDRYLVSGAATAGRQGDDDIVAQTRRLIDEVLPLVASRWPKPPKRMAVE